MPLKITPAPSIEKAYIDEVTDSDVLILLLNKELRPAVEKEYLTAKQNGVRPIVFIRNRTDKREAGLTDFISNQAYKYHCGSFNEPLDLCTKVKTAIIDELLNTDCRASPKSDLPQPPPFVQLGTGPTSRPTIRRP